MAEKKRAGQFDWNPIQDKIKKENEKKDYTDSRFWKLTHDDKGEAIAIIRFLPSPDGTPYVKVRSHSFKYQHNGDKWYVDNCVSTFGWDRECPICAKNQVLYKSSFKKDNNIASERKSKIHYVANIQVISNPNKPEDNGKVFLFKFGQKIYDKIMSKWFPTGNDLNDPDFIQFVPFDLYQGANFKLKGTNLDTKKNKEGTYPNYDTSEFSPQSEHFKGDQTKIQEALDAVVLLDEFIDESKYPKNEDVAKKLACILGGLPETEDEKSDDSDGSGFNMEDDDIPDFEPLTETPEGDVDPDEAFFDELTKK